MELKTQKLKNKAKNNKYKTAILATILTLLLATTTAITTTDYTLEGYIQEQSEETVLNVKMPVESELSFTDATQLYLTECNNIEEQLGSYNLTDCQLTLENPAKSIQLDLK